MSRLLNSLDSVPALRVHQWLDEWENIPFSGAHLRERPQPYFYLFTMSAVRLKQLTGVEQRQAIRGRSRSEETGIQRRLDESRSTEIRRYVRHGYPWSELSEEAQFQEEHRGLQKPGWLPSAIVLNILTERDVRRGKRVHLNDLVKVDESEGALKILLPHIDAQWMPQSVPPLEVIDGQHRLWAFDQQNEEQFRGFELPVVAFHGLDTSWRAYLFWTINIQPKKINPSLAFDLYPLLRNEDWLEPKFGHSIYKEARAQEIVEFLWAHPASPWANRINMLAEKYSAGMVKQSAWVSALIATFFRAWEFKQLRVGGLYGADRRGGEPILLWNRSQQIAFLILAGRYLADAIRVCEEDWAEDIRRNETPSLLPDSEDIAFSSKMSLLNTDQGVRSFLSTVNDLCSMQARNLKLDSWEDSIPVEPTFESVDTHISQLREQPVAPFLQTLARLLSNFDWRSYQYLPEDAPSKRIKASYRGSGGYKLFRQDLLRFLADQTTSSEDEEKICNAAKQVLSAIK